MNLRKSLILAVFSFPSLPPSSLAFVLDMSAEFSTVLDALMYADRSHLMNHIGSRLLW